MTRKHNTRHAPSIRQLEADPRAAYYQAHHDARDDARNSHPQQQGQARYTAFRATVSAFWGSTYPRAVIVSRYAPEGGAWWPHMDASAFAALKAEIARELACVRAALRQPKTYQIDKTHARSHLDRARWLRRALADCV